MKVRIHVNQHVIRSNHKTGEREPVLTAKTYKANHYGHEVIIFGQDGLEAARVLYRPDQPLSCGARVWIETENKTMTIRRYENGIENQEHNRAVEPASVSD